SEASGRKHDPASQAAYPLTGRERHSADQSAKAGKTHQDSESPRSPSQNMVGEDRHQHRIWHAHEADDAKQCEKCSDRLRRQHKTETFQNGLDMRNMSFVRRLLSGSNEQQNDDYGKIAQAVDQKTPA